MIGQYFSWGILIVDVTPITLGCPLVTWNLAQSGHTARRALTKPVVQLTASFCVCNLGKDSIDDKVILKVRQILSPKDFWVCWTIPNASLDPSEDT